MSLVSTGLRPMPRRGGFDTLGLRRAMSDRMLPLLVAAMAFLAALAMAGWFASAALARHWQGGAEASLTVQVPRAGEPAQQGDSTRLAAVQALLVGTPGIASAHALTEHELADLLKPWLGQGVGRLAIPIPAVIAVRLTNAAANLEALSRRLSAAAPGTILEDHGVWIRRLSRLARSLQACAGLAVLLVAGVAAAVIGLATRSGLSARRDAIEIVHGLGATDSYIASRFAGRVTLLAAIGAGLGALAAVPVLLVLARLAAPFGGAPADPETGPAEPWADVLANLPTALWLTLPCLPAIAAAIGFITAQTAVRRWLRRLP